MAIEEGGTLLGTSTYFPRVIGSITDDKDDLICCFIAVFGRVT